jgi:hypothetical protein
MILPIPFSLECSTIPGNRGVLDEKACSCL